MQKKMLKQVAILTGTTTLDERVNKKLKELTLENKIIKDVVVNSHFSNGYCFVATIIYEEELNFDNEERFK